MSDKPKRSKGKTYLFWTLLLFFSLSNFEWLNPELVFIGQYFLRPAILIFMIWWKRDES